MEHVKAVRRGGVLSLLVGALVLLGAGPALAHPSVLATSPQAGYSVTASPSRVEVVFDEPVTVADRGMRLARDDGSVLRTSAVERQQGGRRLALRVREDLPGGRYVVRWTVTAQDGDVVDGGYDFAVAVDGGAGAAAAGLGGSAVGGTAGLTAAVLLRWLLFAGLVLALGGWVGDRLAHRAASRSGAEVPYVTPPVVLGAVLGVVAAVGLLVHLAGLGSLLAGVPAVFSDGLPPKPAARIVLTELVLLAAAAVLASVTARRWAALALGGVVAAEGLRNHLSARAGLLGAALMVVHLGAVSGWLGGLVHVLRTARAWRGQGGLIRRLVAAYARLAFWLFLVVVGTGTVASLLLVPSLRDLVATGYGRVLLAKIALVVPAAGLALAARRLLPGAGDVPPRLLRHATAERGVLAVVLLGSATLVSVPAVAPATTDVGYPVGATGAAVRLGARTGQVSTQIAASENQLEIRVRAPDDDPLVSGRGPEYLVSARVLTPGSDGLRTVALRPCGPGCFLAPVPWGRGLNSLDLRVDAMGWRGGAAVFAVPWPPRTDTDVLRQVVAAMRAAGRFQMRETVTSDTSRPAPPAHEFTLTAEQFLASGPYGDGSQVTDVVVLPSADRTGPREIVFGLPAEGVSIGMVLDRSRRIVRETVTAPKHQIERQFRYGR